MIVTLLSFVVAGTVASGPCLPVEGEVILARHFGAALQGGASLPADAVFSAAPLPGVKRTVSAADIERWARRYGASGVVAADTCFEWPLHPMEPEVTLTAMRASLPAGTEIKIAELSRQGVPAGPLVFPRSGVREPADPAEIAAPVLWHGFVEYGVHKRFAIWAKVNLRVQSHRVVAAADIPAGAVVRADQLREEVVSVFPVNRPQSGDSGSMVGRTTRVSIRAGNPVRLAHLQASPDVKKGDLIELELRTARTVVRAQAEAQSGGRIGDRLVFRNSSSGKLVQARLVSSEKAEVVSAIQLRRKGEVRP